MTDRDRLIDVLARAAFPAAFDRAAHDAMADYYTRAGDFERGQDDARRRVDEALTAAERAGFRFLGPDDGR